VLEAGHVIAGRFRLIRPIGNGGMAEVWWARHELIERDVALKLTRCRTGATEATARFLREARIVGKFQHQNIVAVLDAGELPDEGYLFLAMELLRGASLADRFQPDQPIPASEIVPIVIAVCRGLTTAHEAGVVHRDIKPENVFLAETTGGIVPKLVDFGISQSAQDGRSAITIDGQILGTPSYMSPEQALGNGRLDARSDVWAVGVILYEALAGALPFAGPTSHAILRGIVDDEPEPLPASVDPGLRAIVARCLEKDPERRYRDAAALSGALESLELGEDRIQAVTTMAAARPDADTLDVRSPQGRRAPDRTGRAAVVAAVAGIALAACALLLPKRNAGPQVLVTGVRDAVSVGLRPAETPPASSLVRAELTPEVERRELGAPQSGVGARPTPRPLTRITTPGF